MKNKIKLITIDGDGTLFSYEKYSREFHSSWDALGFAYGLQDVWNDRAKKHYKFGVDDYDWARQDVLELTGRKVEDSFKTLYPIPYANGVCEFAQASKQKYCRGILSSAIDIVAVKASEELNFDFTFCNHLDKFHGFFTGTHEHDVPLWRKHEKLDSISQVYGVKLNEICHIGDNLNDLSVASRVGMFIAFKPKKEEVKQAADFIADNFFEVMGVLGLK